MSKEKVTEDDILQRIDAEISEAIGFGDELSTQRSKAMSYYYGEKFGNEVDGRSQYVDSTVQDSIEWIKPSLMNWYSLNPMDPMRLNRLNRLPTMLTMSYNDRTTAGKSYTPGSLMPYSRRTVSSRYGGKTLRRWSERNTTT